MNTYLNKKIYVYNSYDGKLESILFQEWNSEQQEWIDSYKENLIYNNHDEIYENTKTLWNESGEQWRNFEKTIYNYDDLGNMTTMITSEWEWEAGGSWREEEKTEYIFDTSVDSTLLTVPADYAWKYKLEQIKKSFKMPFSNEWEVSALVNLYYSTEGLLEIPGQYHSFLIYPNPVSDHINIQLEGNNCPCTFELFDMQGRKIMEKQFSMGNNHLLHFLEIPAGTYLYRISSGTLNKNGKIIKQ